MNRFKLLCFFSFLFIAFSIKAQTSTNNDPIVIEIDDKKIHLSEFMDQFNLNGEQLKSLDKNTLNEYLELYLIFKLKIEEGTTLGLDTTSDFKKEFQEYRDKAVSRYLYDNDIYDKALNEAYKRHKYVAKASHIVVAVSEYASSKDTLAAYKKAMNIKNRILKGESFKNLAVEQIGRAHV